MTGTPTPSSTAGSTPSPLHDPSATPSSTAITIPDTIRTFAGALQFEAEPLTRAFKLDDSVLHLLQDAVLRLIRDVHTRYDVVSMNASVLAADLDCLASAQGKCQLQARAGFQVSVYVPSSVTQDQAVAGMSEDINQVLAGDAMAALVAQCTALNGNYPSINVLMLCTSSTIPGPGSVTLAVTDVELEGGQGSGSASDSSSAGQEEGSFWQSTPSIVAFGMVGLVAAVIVGALVVRSRAHNVYDGGMGHMTPRRLRRRVQGLEDVQRIYVDDVPNELSTRRSLF